jgi:hypothetical protein
MQQNENPGRPGFFLAKIPPIKKLEQLKKMPDKH